jgi:hypothetical protein
LVAVNERTRKGKLNSTSKSYHGGVFFIGSNLEHISATPQDTGSLSSLTPGLSPS